MSRGARDLIFEIRQSIIDQNLAIFNGGQDGFETDEPDTDDEGDEQSPPASPVSSQGSSPDTFSYLNQEDIDLLVDAVVSNTGYAADDGDESPSPGQSPAAANTHQAFVFGGQRGPER